MQTYQIFKNQTTAIAPSIHDDVVTPYSARVSDNTYDPKDRFSNHTATWKDYKAEMFDHANIEQQNKTDQWCWLPVTFHVKQQIFGNNQNKANCEYRTWIALEWDTDPTPQITQCQKLSEFVFLSHTSYNSNINKPDHGGAIERYRIMLPLTGKFPTAAEYHDDKIVDDIRHRTAQWCRNMGIGYSIGSSGMDVSALKMVQVQYYPGINPQIGYSTIVINDGLGTSFLTIDDLPTTVDVDLQNSAAKRVAYKHKSGKTGISPEQYIQDLSIEITGNMTPEAEQYILAICKTSQTLHQITSQPEEGKLSRKSIAAAWSALGMSESSFTDLDVNWMRQPMATTSSASCWKDGYNFKNKYPGVLLSIIGKPTLISLSLLSDTFVQDAYTSELMANDVWNNEIVLSTGNYVTRATYGTAQSTLAKFGMGAGKNHGWSISPSTHNDRIIVLTSLNAIVKQARDTRLNHINVPSGEHDFNDMCDPYNITHVYDRAGRLIKAIDAFDAATTAGLPIDNETMIDPSTVTLVIDELHNIELAEYRYNAIFAVSQLIQVYGKRFKKLIGQSASIDNTALSSLIKWDDTIKVTRKDAPTLTYKRYNKGDASKLDTAAMMIITKLITETTDKILVLKDDLIDIQTIQTYCKTHHGITGANVNSSSTRLGHTKAAEMASNADYTMGEDRLIVGTTSLVEGISIKDEVDTAHVIIIGKRNHNYIMQMCGRMRKAKKVVCHHICDIEPERFVDAMAELNKRSYKQEQIRNCVVNAYVAAKKSGISFREADFKATLQGLVSENAGISGIQAGLYYNTKSHDIIPCLELSSCIANAYYTNAATYSSADSINIRMAMSGFNVEESETIVGLQYFSTQDALDTFYADYKNSQARVSEALKLAKRKLIEELRTIIEEGRFNTNQYTFDDKSVARDIIMQSMSIDAGFNWVVTSNQNLLLSELSGLMSEMFDKDITVIIDAWAADITADDYAKEVSIAKSSVLLPINVVRAAYPAGTEITTAMYDDVVRTYIDAGVRIETDRLTSIGGKINYKSIWNSVTGLDCFKNAKGKKGTMKFIGGSSGCEYGLKASKAMVQALLPVVDDRNTSGRFLLVIDPITAN